MFVMLLASWYGRWVCRKRRGVGVFLVHLFHRQTSQRKKKHTQASPQDQDRQEKNKKETGLEQTAHESDVWLSLLFTSFAVACPFIMQHSAISWLYSLARLCGVLPGRSCPGPRPPLQALCVCVCVCVLVCASERERAREREREREVGVCSELAHGLLVK